MEPDARRNGEVGGQGNAIELAGGHRLRLTRGPEQDVLRVESRDGRVRVALVVTPSGTSIELDGGDLSIRASGTLAVEAERLSLRAREGLAVESGGDLELRAAGAVRTEGHSQELVARRGDVAIRANDDVRLDGERIKLNC